MGSSIHRIVIGTAGHIDHGKSSLVRSLTGIDPDRLPEEKQRGLTIDLGFAPWILPDGRKVGIVDVPGHERFIKNMVAGATGIDFVILVIAADDGIMPQTREHFEILQLLGVEAGAIALTKVDLVEKEQADLVEEEIRLWLRETFLAQAPIYRVIANSKEGVETLRQGVQTQLQKISTRSADSVFRMPIQRVFSAQGFGTIVTGIPVSGKVLLGSRLDILPIKKQGKLRAIQAYRDRVDLAQTGHSCALNLSEIEHSEIHRGMVVVEPGYFRPTRLLDVEVQLLARPGKTISHRMPIRFHVGTVEALGRILLFDRKQILPGEKVFAQIELEEEIVSAAKDRFLLRLETPPLTVGGGRVLNELPTRRRKGKEVWLKEVTALAENLDNPISCLLFHLQSAEFEGKTFAELSEISKLPAAELKSLLQASEFQNQSQAFNTLGPFWHQQSWKNASAVLNSAIQKFFEQNPGRLLIALNWLRDHTQLPTSVFDALCELGVKDQRWTLEQGQLRFAGKRPELASEEQTKKEKVSKYIRKVGILAPDLATLSKELSLSTLDTQKCLRILLDEKTVIRLEELYFSQETLERVKQKVVANIRQHGELNIPALRDELGCTRKYLLPVLEHLDSVGLTLRSGARRILKTQS